MTKKNLSYIAGFFDGEGCVRPHFAAIVRKGKVQDRNCVGIICHVTQKHRKVLDWIQAEMGVGIVVPANEGSMFRFRITNRDDQEKFLEALRPYLRVKRRDVDLGLAILSTMSNQQGKRITPDARLLREGFAREMLSPERK